VGKNGIEATLPSGCGPTGWSPPIEMTMDPYYVTPAAIKRVMLRRKNSWQPVFAFFISRLCAISFQLRRTFFALHLHFRIFPWVSISV